MKLSGKLQKIVFGIGVGVAGSCLFGLAVLPSIRESFNRRAIMTQRVQIDAAGASLFGDGATPIGSPQPMIIDDPKAIVHQPKPKDGIRQVDDAYLEAHKIYPLQMKTVDYFVGLVRLGLIAGATIGGIAAFVSKPKRNTAS